METKKANGNQKAKNSRRNGKKSLDPEKIVGLVDRYDLHNLFYFWFPPGLSFEGGKRFEAILNPRNEAAQEDYHEAIGDLREFLKSHPEEDKGEEGSLLSQLDDTVHRWLLAQQAVAYITGVLMGAKYMGASQEQLKRILKEWQRFSAGAPDEYLDRAGADI